MVNARVPEGFGDEPRMKLDSKIVLWLQNREPFKFNGYKCDRCGYWWITVDRHPGVTPMFKACEGCHEGRAVSMGYPSTPPPKQPTFEWYRPSQVEFGTLEPAIRDHVLKGGLMYRRIEN